LTGHQTVTKIGVFKCGNIASSPIFELLLDELGDRQDIRTRTITTGSKMSIEDVNDALPRIFEFNPSLLVFICPNASLPGPTKVRERLAASGIPSVVITDAPGKKIAADLENQGLGCIVVMGDPLIGARREFLDPVEMAIFNSNMIKVLAITGVLRIIHNEIDRLVHSVRRKAKPVLPRLVIDLSMIRDKSDFSNPYAEAKAMAAYGLAEKIAEIDIQASFVEKERDKYVLLAASAHEIAQTAARLAEEAREMEKSVDALVRKPHAKDGRPKVKSKLLQPPTLE
jgi:methylenetetrahydromethanopterin dehydrogenase